MALGVNPSTVQPRFHENPRVSGQGHPGQYDVPVPRGEVAYTVEEAEAAAKKIGGSVVVKAQIHAGGRGKGGGVKVAKNAAEAR